MEPILRHAVRIIVIDPAHRVLLLRYQFPEARILWAAPGGGLEPGETHEQAARRELREELSLEDCVLGPCIWLREHVFPLRGLTYALMQSSMALFSTVFLLQQLQCLSRAECSLLPLCRKAGRVHQLLPAVTEPCSQPSARPEDYSSC